MKISGFTIIRNAILNDYPIVEAIKSILPVVDEMLVSVGKSDDDTLKLIQAIDSDKIRIVQTEWDMNLRKGGQVLAVETDKALAQIAADSDWAFYIQADEVLHEQYHQQIRQACEQYVDDKRVEGLLFDYLHFFGTYRYHGDSRKWYRREIRIIRNENNPSKTPISAYRDAQGFRRGQEKLMVKHCGAAIYHYGWVKSPKQMKTKIKNVSRFWKEGEAWEKELRSDDVFDYNAFDSLKEFEGTHPAVMTNRILAQNWKVDLDISRKKFKLKNALLYWFEKKTGRRLFEFRNYRLLK
ncbi:glycosyl transferase [Dyadobacter tibetensis]|uniref:glycosyl transferase n=1 Tax=Dyadobacter tibetensis TaxID=1211851 RepID=UPI000472B71C|nr:glycosyl transferase [Dyadobacter tibetensis]